MYYWLKRISLGIGLLLLIAPTPVMAESSQANCEICIVELQTQGAVDASEEYIVLANLSGQVRTGVTIQYLSAAGNKGVSAQISLPANSLGVAVSPALKLANPYVETIWPSGMSGTSGTIQLIYQGNVMDQTGWGAATIHEGAAGIAHGKGYSLVRKQTGTGN